MNPNSTSQNQAKPAEGGEKLFYGRLELCALLGISHVTLWKLEKQGRIRAVPGVHIKFYPRAEVERFLSLPKAGGTR